MRKVILVVALALVAIVVVWKLMHRGSEAASIAATGSAGSAVKLRRANGPAAPASIAGRVTKKSDGSGIAGAVVSITSSDLLAELKSATPTLVAVTDATGAFIAPSVPPGGYVLAANAIGFVPGRSAKIWLGAGEHETNIAIALEAGGTLVKGTVSDIGGGPINGARVTIKLGDRIDWKRSELVATTATDGTYQLSLADGEYEAVASHDDYTRVDHDLSVAGKPVTLDFVLTPGGVIRGIVIAKDTKQPVPRALVSASYHGGGFGGGGGMPTTGNEDGTFVIRSLRPGAVSLSAQGKGYATVAPTTVELGIGETADNVRVLVDRAYSISGTVVKQGGKQGVEGIRLGAFSMMGGSVGLAPDPTDTDGAFEIVGLRPGNYTLFAFGEHAVPEIGKSVEIVDKDVTGVLIEMISGVKLSGHVEPPQVAAISLEMAGEIGIANLFQALKTVMVRADADASGAFTLENVPPGAFKIVARTTAGPNGSESVVAGDKDQTGIVVKLEPRASIAGRVIDTNNAPVAGTEVEAEIIDDEKHSNMRMNFSGNLTSAQTASDGTYKIVGLDAGKYRMVVSGDREEKIAEMIANKKDPKRKHVEVELQATTDKTGVDLTVEARDGVIRGQVIGSDRQPATDTWVTAYAEPDASLKKLKEGDEGMNDIRWWNASDPVLTGADGKFVIGKLRKGNYTVVAEGPRGSSRAQKPGVKTGDSVTIELQPLGTLTGKVTLRGAPVAAYSLDCHGPAGSVDRQVASADGAYELEHLAPGSYRCTVEADNGTANGTATVPPGATTLDLVLVPWASLTGRVVSMFDGKPVPKINAITTGMGKSSMANIMQGTAPTTDASGAFTIDHVGAGSGNIMLLQPTAGFEPLATHPYTAKDGEKTDVGTIKIVPPRQGDAGTLGLAVVPDGAASLSVMSVRAGGPAEAAGVVTGDKVTSIDGHTITELTPLQSAAFLSSGHIGIGETVTLGVQHASGDPVTVTITSVKW